MPKLFNEKVVQMTYEFERDQEMCKAASVKVTSEFWLQRSRGQEWRDYYGDGDVDVEFADVETEAERARLGFAALLDDLAGEVIDDMYTGSADQPMLNLAINGDLAASQRHRSRLTRARYHRSAGVVDNLPQLERVVRGHLAALSHCDRNPFSLQQQRETDHNKMVKAYFNDAVDTLEPQCTNYGGYIYSIKDQIAEEAFRIYLEECVVESVTLMLKEVTKPL